jgi:hypothetical protein
MAEDIKSALHDATPSWNGFIYQGKVGLYVCLKIILDKLQTIPTDEVVTQFLESYSIEYEWIEDFSIKVNNVYESLHQVKHKAGTDFGSHISAIVTILNRKLKILSETDFIKYIKFDIADKDNLLAKIHSTFDLMIASGYINENKQLENNWKMVKVDIDDVDSVVLNKLLTEFQSFSENVFDNSKVYFHTSEDVKPPKDLSTYNGMPERHKGSVNGLKTLSTLDIYLGFDVQKDYELSLSDDELEQKILNIINDILSMVQPGEVYLDDDKKIYLAALNELIDNHIVSRHKNIRNKDIQGKGFVEQRESLKFSDLYQVFTLKLRNTNPQYWELNCRQKFESAFIGHCEHIQKRINLNHDEVKSKEKLERLQQFRIDVLSQYHDNFMGLLRLLFPHEIEKNDTSDFSFYSRISEERKIKAVFLSFIQQIDSPQEQLIHKNSQSLAYHPTCIDISDGDDAIDWKINIDKCKYSITKNKYLNKYSGATHIAIKAAPSHDISNIDVELLNIVEQIDMDATNNAENYIHNYSTLKFENIDKAIEIINGK